MNLVLVSQCNGRVYLADQRYYQFHFRGYWSGRYVDNVLLQLPSGGEIQEPMTGAEYLLYIYAHQYLGRTLMGEIVRIKCLYDEDKEIYGG